MICLPIIHSHNICNMFHFSCSLFSWLRRLKFVCIARGISLLRSSFGLSGFRFFAIEKPPLVLFRKFLQLLKRLPIL
nr:MAG TPA: hypothetical protein [Caudoviricetes sp.]